MSTESNTMSTSKTTITIDGKTFNIIPITADILDFFYRGMKRVQYSDDKTSMSKFQDQILIKVVEEINTWEDIGVLEGIKLAKKVNELIQTEINNHFLTR